MQRARIEFEERAAFAGNPVRVLQRRLGPAGDEVAQPLLAVLDGLGAEVAAGLGGHVERQQAGRALAAHQGGEIRAAVAVEDDQFPVQHRPNGQAGEGRGDSREASRQVRAVPAVERRAPGPHDGQAAPAVPLGLKQPAVAVERRPALTEHHGDEGRGHAAQICPGRRFRYWSARARTPRPILRQSEGISARVTKRGIPGLMSARRNDPGMLS